MNKLKYNIKIDKMKLRKMVESHPTIQHELVLLKVHQINLFNSHPYVGLGYQLIGVRQFDMTNMFIVTSYLAEHHRHLTGITLIDDLIERISNAFCFLIDSRTIIHISDWNEWKQLIQKLPNDTSSKKRDLWFWYVPEWSQLSLDMMYLSKDDYLKNKSQFIERITNDPNFLIKSDESSLIIRNTGYSTGHNYYFYDNGNCIRGGNWGMSTKDAFKIRMHLLQSGIRSFRHEEDLYR